MKMVRNSKGQLGSILNLFIVSFVIALLLIMFLLSGFIKKLDDAESGVKLYKEDEIGLYDMELYMNDFDKFVEWKRDRAAILDPKRYGGGGR